jgi:hypothetical protein
MNHSTFQRFLGFIDSQVENGNRIAPIVWGATGVGKTQAVEAFAKSIKAECIVLHLASQDPGDLLGLPTRDLENNTTKWLRPEWMPKENDPGKYVIFLDEFNRANKYVLDVMLPFLLDGTLGTHRVPSNTMIVAAANPGGTEDYGVTDIDDKAMISRLCHITLDAKFSEWAEHVKDDVHPALIEATRGIVKFDKCQIPEEVTPDPRSMHLSGIALKAMSDEDYTLFGWEFLYGMIGDVASAVTAHIDSRGLSTGVKAEDILASYPSVRPAVLQNIENPDASNKMAHGIFDIVKYKKDLSSSEVENLEGFLLDLPEDVFMGFISRLNNPDSKVENLSIAVAIGTKKIIERMTSCGSSDKK